MSREHAYWNLGLAPNLKLGRKIVRHITITCAPGSIPINVARTGGECAPFCFRFRLPSHDRDHPTSVTSADWLALAAITITYYYYYAVATVHIMSLAPPLSGCGSPVACSTTVISKSQSQHGYAFLGGF
eukprot:scaffold9338_cov113-Isochrysis_galbana.AAC.11